MRTGFLLVFLQGWFLLGIPTFLAFQRQGRFLLGILKQVMVHSVYTNYVPTKASPQVPVNIIHSKCLQQSCTTTTYSITRTDMKICSLVPRLSCCHLVHVYIGINVKGKKNVRAGQIVQTVKIALCKCMYFSNTGFY